MRVVFVFALVVAAASAATIPKDGIEVKVLYEETPKNMRHFEGVKNLQEKTQLSPEEVPEVLKHLPMVDEEEMNLKIVTGEKEEESEAVGAEAYKEENIDDIYETIQEIILNGVKKIEKDVEETEEPKFDKTEVLGKVNATLEGFLETTRGILQRKGLKQASNQNILTQIINTFQTTAQGLTQAFRPGQSSTVLGDTPQNPPPVQQNPFQFITATISQVQQNLNNALTGNNQGTPATQSDENPQPGQQNPFQFITNAGQSLINNINNVIRPSTAPQTESDENPATPSNPLNFIQMAGQQVTNFINNNNPFNPQPPAGESDENPAPSGPLNFLQNAQQALQSINPFNPSPNKPANPNPNPNPIQAGISQASETITNLNQQGQNIINQVVPGASSTGDAASPPAGASPPDAAAPAADQPARPLQTALQNLNPFRRRTTTTKKPAAAPASEAPAEVAAPEATTVVVSEAEEEKVSEEAPTVTE